MTAALLAANDDASSGTLTPGGTQKATGNLLGNDTGVDLAINGIATGAEAGHGTFMAVGSDGPIGPNDPTTIVGTYGFLVVSAAGGWEYQLLTALPDTRALAGGVHASDTFTYRAIDSGSVTDLAQLTIDIVGSNAAPRITSNGAGSRASLHVLEGRSLVTHVHARDDGQKLHYSIGGADAARFAIDSKTGALHFRAAPNHERPHDHGHDNTYNVVVKVSDGALTDTQALSVHVDRAGATISGFLFGDRVDGTRSLLLPAPTKWADRIDGHGGDDTLAGLGGRDSIHGGDGNDVLRGGAGADRLWGDAGHDSFVFDTRPGAGNIDTILDFGHHQDTLRLSNDVMAGLGAAGKLGSAAFYAHAGAHAAHDPTDRVIYDSASGKLFYDADGADGHAAQQLAVLSGHPHLTAADILIV